MSQGISELVYLKTHMHFVNSATSKSLCCRWIDAGKFLTGFSAIGSIAVPAILFHAQVHSCSCNISDPCRLMARLAVFVQQLCHCAPACCSRAPILRSSVFMLSCRKSHLVLFGQSLQQWWSLEHLFLHLTSLTAVIVGTTHTETFCIFTCVSCCSCSIQLDA